MEIQKQNYTEEEQKEIAANAEQVDEGEYVAKLADVDDEKLVGGPFGPAFLFIFEILEEPYEGKKIGGPVSMKWRPDNKLDKWLSALGVETSTLGTKLNPKSLAGRQVRIWVEPNKKGYSTVKKINPLRKSGNTATPVTTPVAAASSRPFPGTAVGDGAVDGSKAPNVQPAPQPAPQPTPQAAPGNGAPATSSEDVPF